MKKTILILIALFTLGTFTSNAQSPKFAHVSSTTVLDSIQSYKNITKEEQRIYTEAQKQSEAIQNQIAKMEQEYYAMADTIDDFTRNMYATDIQKKQQDLYTLEQYMQSQLQILNQRLMQLMEMYKDAVAVVAKKNSITYVLDADSQVLYADPAAKNITNEVRTELLRMDKEKPVLE